MMSVKCLKKLRLVMNIIVFGDTSIVFFPDSNTSLRFGVSLRHINHFVASDRQNTALPNVYAATLKISDQTKQRYNDEIASAVCSRRYRLMHSSLSALRFDSSDNMSKRRLPRL